MVVLARLLLHVFFVPVYEGPDEPFHLARAMAVAGGEIDSSGQVSSEIVASVLAHPCGPDLTRAFGCPAFGGQGAAFNILGKHDVGEDAEPRDNYQAHQPPLYYLFSGAVLWLLGLPAGSLSPELSLLTLRLIAFLLVGLGLWRPLRTLGTSHGRWFEGLFLGSLLLPGAAESLIRVANDAPLFLWSLLVLVALDRGIAAVWIASLLALGPLLKLTALPVVAFAVVVLWRSRGRIAAVLGMLASLAFVPIQLLRGFDRGGVLELNALNGLEETLAVVVKGIMHSAYTFVKTAAWLGGWSSFRPPLSVLVTGFVLLIAWAICSRSKSSGENRFAHAVALVVFAGGFLLFAIGKRQLFDVWGAVGGWYFWGIVPWVACLFSDQVRLVPGSQKRLLLASAAWLAMANGAWFWISLKLYGLP
ncbi:MAG: DUF2142 domain-containing protein [Acidobacteriota bacterium]